MSSRPQIVATIGPSSDKPEVLKAMIEAQVDVARFNFEWFDEQVTGHKIEVFRATATECGRAIPIIADFPRSRVQLAEGHTYDASLPFSISSQEEEMLQFCVENKIEYIALSFVGSSEDVARYREAIATHKGAQKIIAKIERKVAVDAIDEIIAVSDAVMVARGDLGKEVPLEQIPFIQKMIITKANIAQIPVITATQMLFSMVEHSEPTRAEVADVAEAIMDGSDAVMLSEETASGHFPVESVMMMNRIVIETERRQAEHSLNPL
ncbi:MAG: pyruvate kinase [Minisyncoccia bacterium]